MNIKYSTTFQKQYKKTPLQVQKKVKIRLDLFIQSPMDKTLNNHALTGKFHGLRSINITGYWRAIYSIRTTQGSKQEYYFELLGTHSQLYR